MRDRQTCVDCGKLSPETETNYTLISSQFGWRLTRWRGDDGSFHVEWRCPDCWREHKRAKQASDEHPSQAPARSHSTRPPPIQTRPLPSFPSRPPPPSQAIGPLPPIPRPPPSRPSRPPPRHDPAPLPPSSHPRDRKTNPR